MIKVAFFALAVAACPKTIIDNRSGEWNAQDTQTLARANVRCAEFYPDAPCVKKFIKKDNQTYNVICGK